MCDSLQSEVWICATVPQRMQHFLTHESYFEWVFLSTEPERVCFILGLHRLDQSQNPCFCTQLLDLLFVS